MTTPFSSPASNASVIGGRPTMPAALVANNPAFRTPSSSEENGYVDSPIGAYAPVLTVSADNGTPDSRRVGAVPIREAWTPDGPPEAWWNNSPNSPGRESLIRHRSAEDIDPAPDTLVRGPLYGSGRPTAEDPRRRPVENAIRPTAVMAPSSYSFTRPFAQETPHRLTGVRFSMADHRRKYSDMETGMLPQTTRRNTYRRDPGPWDQAMTDYPQNTPTDWGGYHTANIPSSGSRSGRLDAY